MHVGLGRGLSRCYSTTSTGRIHYIVSLILKIEVLNLEQTLLTEYACLKTQFS